MWALVELALLVAMAIAVKVKFHRSRVRQMVDRFDGPPAWPFLGNVLMFLGSPTGKYAIFSHLTATRSASSASRAFSSRRTTRNDSAAQRSDEIRNIRARARRFETLAFDTMRTYRKRLKKTIIASMVVAA